MLKGKGRAGMGSVLWAESFWLPAGLNWSSLEAGPGPGQSGPTGLPKSADFLLALPLAAAFCLLRVAFELCCFFYSERREEDEEEGRSCM